MKKQTNNSEKRNFFRRKIFMAENFKEFSNFKSWKKLNILNNNKNSSLDSKYFKPITTILNNHHKTS